MFSKTDISKKSDLLDKAKAAREERAFLRQKEIAVVKIQALVRGFLCRRRFIKGLLTDFDQLLGFNNDQSKTANTTCNIQLHPATDVFFAIKKFLYVYDESRDNKRFELLCRYILKSMESQKDAKVWYVSLAINKNLVLPWLQQLKEILTICCKKLKKLKPDSPTDVKLVTLYLHMIVTFTDTATWNLLKMPGAEALTSSMKQLCANIMGHLNAMGLYPMLQALLVQGLARKKPGFTHVTFSAVFTMALRPLIASNFSTNLLLMFISHILIAPAIVLHLSNIAPELLTTLKNHQLLFRCLKFINDHQNKSSLLKIITPNSALCLLGNLTQLCFQEPDLLSNNVAAFTHCVNSLLSYCSQLNDSNNKKKKSNTAQWHPILGWFNHTVDPRYHDCMMYVVQQLSLLWSQVVLNAVFISTLKALQPEDLPKPTTSSSDSQISKGSSFLKRLQRSTAKLGNQRSGKSLSSSEVLAVCRVCEMYQMTLATLTELRRDILTGLSYRDILLPRLWRFIAELGSHGGLKVFLEYLNAGVESQPIFSVLVLFCDVAGYLIAIVDDVEFYENQVPFHSEDLIAVTSFLNSFVYKMIWDRTEEIHACRIGEGKQKYKDLFNSTHNLLMLLYDRDCRRSFATSANHWLIKDLKQSSLRGELEKNSKRSQLILQLIPHVIQHKERVILFRKKVLEEKRSLGLTESALVSPHSTLISVHRSRLVEDGYQQLASLSANTFKGLIRVKFINEQGLDEAGIDQDGVFKEFLEETISTIFNPSLNLFKTTSEQRLYPSSTSFITENHLHLFEFVGKMLAKAVYEGIVVEVPFASFFLSQMLDRQHNNLYSPIDELPSLDPELYKNLTYVKHYEGDISDLDLTFSYDEDIMGKIVNHELVPGGKAVSVTNENKIKYIHLMAHFRMCAQIREQTKAFKRGFLSIVTHEWLSWFSGPQLQRLISGDNAELDLSDLRKHTQYYGGFHNSHRVINWLFDILSNDFTAQERAQFLKFITSCSKPPLLGFAHLEPPFSIRCVEVSDDQDTGDTVGSVLRGFLRIQKRDPVGRLPTSSTCFNLLKLPNYQKKSTLKEKLRYAITSNTGFELS